MKTAHDILIGLNGYLWGPPMLFLLMGTHLFLTFRLRFIQRFIFLGIRLSVSKDGRGEGDVSQFGSLSTALAATIGTGNIVGVATAVSLGGPGAVFWCWLTGVFGIATKYSEALLSVKYRVKTADGTMLGGPMYALERGLRAKWLAVLFCAFTACAAFGIGNMVQSNSISTLLQSTCSVPPWVSGLALATITALVILGGVRSIANVCGRLVPFMAIFYTLGCVVILIFNYRFIGPALELILKSAFTTRAAGGGFIAGTMLTAARYGVARGLFSNESGLGSAPIVAAAARTKNAVRQALVSSTGTFWDTVVICAVTGVVIVSTILRNPALVEAQKGETLTKVVFAQIPFVGPVILSVGLLTFVFSTILGWSYYGERAGEYLFGKKAILPYRLAWVAAVFFGAIVSVPFVWDLADSMNALMALPNLIALLLLSPVLVRETQTLWRIRSTK